MSTEQRERKVKTKPGRPLLEKLLAGLANLDLMHRAGDRALPYAERIAAIAELAGRPGDEVVADLLTLAETDEPLRREILVRLGRRSVEDGRQPLLDFLSRTREPWAAAMAAEILERCFHDDTGLRRFQGDLGSLDETAFLRAWELYRAVAPERRREAYVERVARALERQVRPPHLAALLHLLEDAEATPALAELVVLWLSDRRRVRVPFLGRRGRMGDFAAECLLTTIGMRRPRGLRGRLRFRRLRQRVRSRVRTLEDWQELLAERPRWLTGRGSGEELEPRNSKDGGP